MILLVMYFIYQFFFRNNSVKTSKCIIIYVKHLSKKNVTDDINCLMDLRKVKNVYVSKGKSPHPIFCKMEYDIGHNPNFSLISGRLT
jgi:hypothetical protein